MTTMIKINDIIKRCGENSDVYMYPGLLMPIKMESVRVFWSSRDKTDLIDNNVYLHQLYELVNCVLSL